MNDPSAAAGTYPTDAQEVGLLAAVRDHVQQRRFQRSLSLIAGMSGLLGGLDVTLEHYKGSYGQRVMYSPVLISSAVFASGVAGAVKPQLARTWLPATSWLLLGDGLLGFAFHVRGIHRKPGGWGLLVYNTVMGPPLFAPLLLGIGGFLGLVAARLLPEETAPDAIADDVDSDSERDSLQRAMTAATSLTAALNGIEALSSHYKSGFKTWSQWIPVVISPALTITSAAALVRPRRGRIALPAWSALAVAAGGVGFMYHMRGVKNRPDGFKRPLYNLTYGPPAFAPLLFAASGFMGILATLLRPSTSRKAKGSV